MNQRASQQRSDQSDSMSEKDLPVPARRYFLFAAIAGTGCLLDLLTKRLVFQAQGLPGQQPIWWLWEGFVGIETALNTGALFGLGTNGVTYLAAISVVALAGVIIWFVAGKLGRSLSLTILLGFICAGILGNLYDRLGLWSLNAAGEVEIRAVRDWIRLSYGDWVWPNFNLADSYLVCSAAWLFGQSLRNSSPDSSVEAQPEAEKRAARRA